VEPALHAGGPFGNFVTKYKYIQVGTGYVSSWMFLCWRGTGGRKGDLSEGIRGGWPVGNTRTLGLTLCDKKKGSTNEQQPVSQLLNVISTITPCLGDIRGRLLKNSFDYCGVAIQRNFVSNGMRRGNYLLQ
jgi:hypothetical protein